MSARHAQTSSPRGRLIYLTGPTGAGKTSAGMLWTATRDTPTWFFDWDAVRNTIVRADKLRAMPELDIDTQYQLAADVIAESAAATVAGGRDCVVAGGWAHRSVLQPRYAHTWDALEALDPLVLVLLPRLEVCFARHARRVGADFERSRDAVEFWHPLFEPWALESNAALIDTSELSEAATVRELERHTARYFSGETSAV